MRMKRTVLPFLAILILGAAVPDAGQEARARTMKIKVTAEQANLREKPDIGSSIVQMIPGGSVLEADRKEGEWFFVRWTLEDGGVIGGYIHESLVEVVEGEVPVPETKPAGEESPPRRRASRQIGIGRIKMPDLRTGDFPLEFSFSAGLGSVAPGDLNSGTRGYADWYGGELGVQAAEKPGVLHFAYLFGFELTYRLSPRLAFGLGADYLRVANRDETRYRDALISQTLVTGPAARAVPLKVAVRFYPGAGFYVRGALGIYSAKARYLYRHEGADSWEQWKGSASSTGFGGEAALGGEWEVAERTAFFAEAGFRLASFRGLTGKNVHSSSDGEAQTEPGTLYFYRQSGAGANTYPVIFVAGSPPAGATGSREARLNLSGTAVRAGVRYRF
jgi:hypothetical protein